MILLRGLYRPALYKNPPSVHILRTMPGQLRQRVPKFPARFRHLPFFQQQDLTNPMHLYLMYSFLQTSSHIYTHHPGFYSASPKRAPVT